MRGFFAVLSEPQFGDGIDTISKKERLIVASSLACTQLEIYMEQIFVFQNIFEDPRELAFFMRQCSYLLFNL